MKRGLGLRWWLPVSWCPPLPLAAPFKELAEGNGSEGGEGATAHTPFQPGKT